MKRRKFIANTSLTAAAALLSFPIVKALPKKPALSRIGLTTVVFRNQFKNTAPGNRPVGEELILKNIPEYFNIRFGIKNVELWSRHFESRDSVYLENLKKSFETAGSNLIDIQVDTKNDLSDPDQVNRDSAIDEMKEWIDIGSDLGTTFIRISSMKKSLDYAIESIEEVNRYAESKGIISLVENHNDLFSDVSNHLKVAEQIRSENIGLLADFGNYGGDADRYDALKQIAPYTKLVSAKTKDFNSDVEHLSYDFAQCIRIFEEAGYSGIYSLEQWGKVPENINAEKLVDWMISETIRVL